MTLILYDIWSIFGMNFAGPLPRLTEESYGVSHKDEV
jgi:hypothetical protein